MKKNLLALAALMLAMYPPADLIIKNDDGNDPVTTMEDNNGDCQISIPTEDYNWLCQHGTEPATGEEQLAEMADAVPDENN